ncbi:MAG: LemA family protein [Clostridiales bacterium]|jgi:LemA protein|nr:LemA family protein [Clostridiales bacterium]
MAVVIIILAAIAAFIAFSYNSLTKDKNRIELAQVELRKYEEAGDPKDIDNARKYYAAVLRDYNTKVERFPTSLIAELFNFPKMHTDDFDEGL